MEFKSEYITSFTLILALVLSLSISATADDEYANTAAIFEIGAGARTLGMGGAFIGLADDENAAVYNPAGLAFLDGGGINTTYDKQFDALTYNSAVGSVDSIGVAGMNLSSGLIDVTDKFGIDTGDTTSYSSTGLVGGFGLRADKLGLGSMARHLGLGLQMRSFSSTLHSTTGSGYSLSLSALYRKEIGQDGKLQLGVVIPSVIVGEPIVPGFPLGSITYKDQSGNIVHKERFPNNFGLGVGFKLNSNKGNETNMAIDWRAQGGLRAGLEQEISVGALRMGVTGTGSISAGGGIKLGSLGSGELLEKVRIDGVYEWQPSLGNSWMLSFSAKL